jgi:uncharacterized protein
MDEPARAELEALLASSRVGRGCLKNFSAVDGFLAAMLAGPVWISPEEWLPRIFGAREPKWLDLDEAERVCDVIRARYEQVERQLEETPDSYVPIFRTLHDGSVVAADWARGFHIGVEMRSPLWDALTASRKGMRYFTTILSQLPDWDGKIMADLGRAAVLDFRREGRRFIPFCVREIRRFWAERRDSSQARPEAADRPMVN